MSAPKLLLSPLAEQNLIEIGIYIAEGDPVRARSFIGELHDFLTLLSANPLIGRARPDLARGLRSIPFVGYSYTVFYRAKPRRDGVKVERVLHGARDVGSLF